MRLALREQVGWGTLGNILSIGPWLNLFLDLIPTLKDNLALQIGMFLLGVLIQGIATAVYIGVDAGAGPRDSLMLAIHRTTGVSIRVARGAIEVIVVLIGWLLGGPAGDRNGRVCTADRSLGPMGIQVVPCAAAQAGSCGSCGGLECTARKLFSL